MLFSPLEKHLILALWCLTHGNIYITIKACNSFFFTNTGTFPAVHSLQHPLIIAFIWGHPLSAHAVGGEIPVPLLRRGHCHSLSALLHTQNNNPNDKISLPVSLGRNFCFSRVYLSLGSSQSMQSYGHNPLSTSQTYDFSPPFPLSLLTPSLVSALPFFSSLCCFFSPFPFSPAYSIPFIVNGACGLWSLGLSSCVMCECVFSGSLCGGHGG